MDDDVIEGEVLEYYDPREEPRIAYEVEDFQQRLDEMKGAFFVAADMIGRGAFHSPPRPEPPQVPSKGYMVIRTCGKVLVATGSWLLDKYPAPVEETPEEAQQEDWAWANQDAYKQPVLLPFPDLHRFWRL